MPELRPSIHAFLTILGLILAGLLVRRPWYARSSHAGLHRKAGAERTRVQRGGLSRHTGGIRYGPVTTPGPETPCPTP